MRCSCETGENMYEGDLNENRKGAARRKAALFNHKLETDLGTRASPTKPLSLVVLALGKE